MNKRLIEDAVALYAKVYSTDHNLCLSDRVLLKRRLDIAVRSMESGEAAKYYEGINKVRRQYAGIESDAAVGKRDGRGHQAD